MDKATLFVMAVLFEAQAAQDAFRIRTSLFLNLNFGQITLNDHGLNTGINRIPTGITVTSQGGTVLYNGAQTNANIATTRGAALAMTCG